MAQGEDDPHPRAASSTGRPAHARPRQPSPRGHGLLLPAPPRLPLPTGPPRALQPAAPSPPAHPFATADAGSAPSHRPEHSSARGPCPTAGPSVHCMLALLWAGSGWPCQRHPQAPPQEATMAPRNAEPQPPEPTQAHHPQPHTTPWGHLAVLWRAGVTWGCHTAARAWALIQHYLRAHCRGFCRHSCGMPGRCVRGRRPHRRGRACRPCTPHPFGPLLLQTMGPRLCPATGHCGCRPVAAAA